MTDAADAALSTLLPAALLAIFCSGSFIRFCAADDEPSEAMGRPVLIEFCIQCERRAIVATVGIPYHGLVLTAVGRAVAIEILILDRYAFEAMLKAV